MLMVIPAEEKARSLETEEAITERGKRVGHQEEVQRRLNGGNVLECCALYQFSVHFPSALILYS